MPSDHPNEAGVADAPNKATLRARLCVCGAAALTGAPLSSAALSVAPLNGAAHYPSHWCHWRHSLVPLDMAPLAVNPRRYDTRFVPHAAVRLSAKRRPTHTPAPACTPGIIRVSHNPPYKTTVDQNNSKAYLGLPGQKEVCHPYSHTCSCFRTDPPLVPIPIENMRQVKKDVMEHGLRESTKISSR